MKTLIAAAILTGLALATGASYYFLYAILALNGWAA